MVCRQAMMLSGTAPVKIRLRAVLLLGMQRSHLPLPYVPCLGNLSRQKGLCASYAVTPYSQDHQCLKVRYGERRPNRRVQPSFTDLLARISEEGDIYVVQVRLTGNGANPDDAAWGEEVA